MPLSLALMVRVKRRVYDEIKAIHNEAKSKAHEVVNNRTAGVIFHPKPVNIKQMAEKFLPQEEEKLLNQSKIIPIEVNANSRYG